MPELPYYTDDLYPDNTCTAIQLEAAERMSNVSVTRCPAACLDCRRACA